MSAKDLVIYQTDAGAIELPVDIAAETIWATRMQIAALFDVTPQNITMHLKSIYGSSEMDREATSKDSLLVQTEGGRTVERKVRTYNLDAIIAIGYRISSRRGTEFRKWATKTLRTYISDGYVINPVRIEHNKSQFLIAIEDMKLLAEGSEAIGSGEIADLVQAFASTWFSLDAYDRGALPNAGHTKSDILVGAEDLSQELVNLRKKLIEGGEATEIFGVEREKGGLKALFGNVFQSFGGADVYPTIEEKAAHLLYFVVKNHVFLDGNKRSGAYSFVWFLREAGVLNMHEISPQALTAITLLMAESKPDDKDKMIGLVLLMLGVQKHS